MTTATDSARLGIPPEYPPMTPELADRWKRFCEQEAEQQAVEVDQTVLAWRDREFQERADHLLDDRDVQDWLDNMYEELGGLVYPNIEDNREKLDGLRFFAEAMNILKCVARLDVAPKPTVAKDQPSGTSAEAETGEATEQPRTIDRLKHEAEGLLADQDVRAFIEDNWRLHVSESWSFD